MKKSVFKNILSDIARTDREQAVTIVTSVKTFRQKAKYVYLDSGTIALICRNEDNVIGKYYIDVEDVLEVYVLNEADSFDNERQEDEGDAEERTVSGGDFTTKDIQNMTGFSPCYIYELRRARKIPFVKDSVTGKISYPKVAIGKWMSGRKTK